MQTKQCNTCKLTKKLLEFYKRKDGVLGCRSQCIACDKESWKKYSKDNRVKLADKQRERYHLDIEKSRKIQLASQHKHRDKRMAYKKKYREENKERLNADARLDYYANLEHYRGKCKKYYAINKDSISEAHKKWRKLNVDKLTAMNKKKVEELTDSYVRGQLLKRSVIKIDIPNELIEVKRLQIKIRRIANEKR